MRPSIQSFTVLLRNRPAARQQVPKESMQLIKLQRITKEAEELQHPLD